MAVGLEIRNENNIIQIDSTYHNLEMKSRGTSLCDINTPFNNGWFYRDVVVPNYGAPILAIANTYGVAPCFIYDVAYSGNDVSFRIMKGGGGYVDWYHYDMPTQSTNNFGFEVYDENGVKTFDGSKKYMRVLDSFDGNTDQELVDIGLKNYGDKRIAVAQGVLSLSTYVQDVIPGVLWEYGFLNGAMVVAETEALIGQTVFPFGQGPSVPFSRLWFQRRFRYLVLDRTGH